MSLSVSSSIQCETDFLQGMDMEENESWSPDDSSSNVCSVSASSVAGSVVEASSSPISGSAAEAFSECSDNPEFLHEPIHVDGKTLMLPSDLCTNSHLLKSILTMENITNHIPAEDLETLFSDLPKFPKHNTEEKKKTFQKLLSGENFAFHTNPISDFAEKLKEGHYHYDVVETAKELRESLSYLQKIHHKKYKINLLIEGILNRNRILQAKFCGYNKKVSTKQKFDTSKKVTVSKSNLDLRVARVKSRFDDILRNVNEDVGASSSSDNDSSGDESPSSYQETVKVPDVSEVDLDFVNPTLMPSQTSPNETSLLANCQIQDTEKVFLKLLHNYVKRTRKKKINVECSRSKMSEIPVPKLRSRSSSPTVPQAPNRTQLLSGGHTVSSQEPEVKDETIIQSSTTDLENEVKVSEEQEHKDITSPSNESVISNKPLSTPYSPNLQSLLMSSPGVPSYSNSSTGPSNPSYNAPLPDAIPAHDNLLAHTSSSLHDPVHHTNPVSSSNSHDPYNSKNALRDSNPVCTPNSLQVSNSLCPKNSLHDSNPFPNPNQLHHANALSESNSDRPLHDSNNLLLHDHASELIHLPDYDLSGNILTSWPSYSSLNKFCDDMPSSNDNEQLLESTNSEDLDSQEDQIMINQSQETQTSDVSFEENFQEYTEDKKDPKISTVVETTLTEEKLPKLKRTNSEMDLKRAPPGDSDVSISNPKRKKLSAGIQPFSPATLSDLNGLNMMDLPIHFDENNDMVSVNDAHPPNEKHCLFALIRDIICSSPFHRMTMDEIKTNLHQWAQKLINQQSPYNTWESLLQPAVAFLAGEFPDSQPDDFVPFIEYKANIDTYQWIGAGRDTDNNLNQLANFWKQCKNETRVSVINPPSLGDTQKGLDMEQTPPSRCPTTWTVRPCTAEEKKTFHIQEKERFDNPHKPYVYRIHGYESVVGPLRGIFSLSQSAPYGRLGREHSMLTRERPTFVTILALVRDAVARLPNGQGTRGDVCTLLQDSQYLCTSNKDAELNTVVSGALDRLHSEFDPCVKYDQKRKIWLYLHRNRTEQEFEKLHKESQGKKQGKNARKQRSQKENETQTQTKGKVAKANIVEMPHTSTPVESVSTVKTSPVADEPLSKATDASSRPQSALQKALKDIAPDLRSHILKIKKQNKLAQQQQKQLQKQPQVSNSPVEVSSSPPTYTSCVEGVTTTASAQSVESSPTSHKRLESQAAKSIPTSSAPSLKSIGQKQVASSRVVLVKAQAQNSLIQDRRKPIMILKPKGTEDGSLGGKCVPRQVYFIDDKSLSTEPGLTQFMKQPLVSSQTVQKMIQTQTSTVLSPDKADSLDVSQEKGTTGQVSATQFAVSATARQGPKKINLTPTQQKQLQQLLFTKPQLVKAGNHQSLNQLKQVLLFKTGVLPKRNKSDKGDEQTILCHNPLSGDSQIGQMILVKQQESNSSQIIGESMSNEQVSQLQFDMETQQKVLTKKKLEASSGSVTKTTPSASSPILSVMQGPPPPYTATESKVTTSAIDSLVLNQSDVPVTQHLHHLESTTPSNKEDQTKMSSTGVNTVAQNKPVSNQALKTSQVLKLMAGSNSRVVLSTGETKSLPFSFSPTVNKTSPTGIKPDHSNTSTPTTSSPAAPLVKHQVLGKFVTANFGNSSQNQQILVQNPTGMVKNNKNQPLMAKLVTPGSSNGQLIKVLSTQGQPIIGKISAGGSNSKPVVAKIHNAQGQPIYCMEDLFPQTNKAPAACYRLAPSQGKQSKQQKLYATLNSANQSIGLADQLVKQNILIKPHQTSIPSASIQSPQAVPTSGIQQTHVKAVSNQQKSTTTSQALLQTGSSLVQDKTADTSLAKSHQPTLFTTQYVQTISNPSSSQKIQVALTQSDVQQQFQQYLQANQIFTTVVSSSDGLQTLTVGKQQTGTQKISVSQLVTGKDEGLANGEANQMKQSATLMPAGTQFVTTSMSGIHRVVQQPNKFITTANTTPQLVRMVPNGGLKTLGSNSIILTSGKPHQGDPSQATSQSTVLLAPQGLQTTNGRTLTLFHQGNGQPLFLPSNFQAGTLNIKTLQGMKVIPFTQNGRPQVVARFISPNVKTTQQPSPNVPQKLNGDTPNS